MIPILLFLFAFSQKQISDNPIIIDALTSRYASEYILVTTPSGVYTFDRIAKTWKSITTRDGLPDNQVDIIGLDEGILWVATPQGLASADVRLNDWQTYELTGKITGIAFDENYVWITGDFGMKRFDKYVESWEDIYDKPANDILFDKTYLWIAVSKGIFRYDREFERIEEMYTAPKCDYNYIIDTRSRIWFLSDDYFVAYEKNTESWSEHTALDITDYSILGDSLFVISNGSVLLFNPATNNWQEFVEVKGLDKVNGISINPRASSYITFATDKGLVLYNWLTKSRDVYSRANGMQSDSTIDAYETSNYIFAIGRDNIQYLEKETGIWHVENLAPIKGIRARVLHYDEAGLHADIVRDLDIRLQGRAYYSLSTVISDSTTSTDYENINLRLIGQHESNRILSLYYDDTDKEQVTYGFGYRGLESDFVYRVNGGFLSSEYYEFNLVPRFSTFGANTKLRHVTHSLALQGGQLKSSFRSEFFYGKSFTHRDTVMDVQYLKNTFYKVPPPSAPIREGTDTIFVDDRLPETNEIDTRVNLTIGGITGDFDPLINGFHYFMDYDRNIIHFLSRIEDDYIVVLKSNEQEIVIQSDQIQGNMLENVYALGPDIVPASLELSIYDTLGTLHPLNDFGIDNDDNNQVDAEFINYRLGYLIFPQTRPFPDEVYEQQINVYLMDYEFSTQSLFYYLSENPVMIGSEKVVVDGEQLTRDHHYIVDYSSGTVLFLSEDVVSAFSEIEIQYVSVERDREDIFYSVQPNIKIGSDINFAPGFSQIDDERFGHLSGKYQKSVENKSLMVVPQLAINEERAWGQDHLLVANYHMFTVNANYRGYSEDFESFGLSDRRYGQLRHSGTVSLGLEPITYVRLKGTVNREALVDSSDVDQKTQYVAGRIEYLNPRLPNAFLLVAKNTLPEYEKIKYQLNTNYNFQVYDNKMRFSSVARRDVLTFDAENERKTFEYVVNTNISLRFPLRVDIYLHGVDLYDNDNRDKDENEIRLALNADFIPGLYYTGNFQQKKELFYLASSKDLSIRHYLYNNLNIAPGRWYSAFSIINFSFGIGSNFDQYIDNLAADQDVPSIIFSPLEENIATLTDARNTYARIFLTPFSNLNIELKHTRLKSGTAYYDIPELRPTYINEARVEYDHEKIGFLTSTLYLSERHIYPAQTIRNIYLEWTKPWSARLRTKLSGNVRNDLDDYETAQTENSESNVRFETLWRFGGRSYVNINLGAKRQDRYATGITNSLLPGFSVNLNLIQFLFLRFDYEANVILSGSTTHLVSAKIAGSF